MRRETIVRAAERLVADIVETGLDHMLDEATEKYRQSASKEDERNPVSLAVFQKYSVAISKYEEAETEVAKILGLDLLFAPETWERLGTRPDPGFLFDLYRSVNFAKVHLPKITKLFRQEYVQEAKSGTSLPRELEGKTLVTFILPEEAHEYSSPARLISALDAIANIYSVFCTLDGGSESDLIVLACDSGSDKSFDFLGIAKLMEEVRKFVVAIWDRRVFYRHMHASQCISLIAESLPIVEKIEELKRSKALEPEQAELLKRKTLHGAIMFLESGIFIEDMVKEGAHSPRQLMRPEPKLLAAPTKLSASTAGHAETVSDSENLEDGSPTALSQEETAVLEHLLAKARKPKVTSGTDHQRKKPTRRKPSSDA